MIKINDFKDINPLQIFGDIKKYMAYNISASSIDGLIMELGVYKGNTLNHIADIVSPKIVTGFDSFNGLPEPWEMSEAVTVEAGRFSVKSEIPKIRKNATLEIGLFSDTLSTWLDQQGENIQFLHLDCDLYSSTIDALTILNPKIKSGTIMVFDDLYAWQDEDDYPYWRRGQWKALREWVNDNDREIEIVSRMKRRFSGAIKVLY